MEVKDYKGIHAFFLLGGHDLEMKTISELLDKKGLLYADHELTWSNAYAGSYKSELEQYGDSDSWVIYGIELMEDIELPSNYVAIDHHGVKSDGPSALEQVTGMLDESMTRYQQLVALNDRLYIPGMMEYGATKEEIQDIRYRDREAQGVSEEDEQKAVLSIQNKEIYGELIVVHSLTSSFSPICDRLYPYDKLLVYTDEEFTYYGKGTDMLQKKFRQDILDGRVYYGGGPNGYLGGCKGAFTQDEIKEIVNQIIGYETI